MISPPQVEAIFFAALGGRRLVSSSHDGTVILWDASPQAPATEADPNDTA